MKWQRFLPVGCAGIFLVCVALPFIPYFWRVGQASQAQQHWVQNGASRYTVIALTSCCPSTGRVKLTVENGLVTAADPIDLPNFAVPSTPSYFDFMSIEAMLRKAGNATLKSWDVPWFSELIVEYDPTYGYITNYTENPTGWLAKFIGHVRTTPYSYTAYDLQFIEP